MDSPKRYDEKAVSEILQRAAELERARRRGHGGGLTLTDLEKVASEAGLDPSAVRAAVEERDRGETAEAPAGLFGGPARLRFERVIDGELDEDGVEELLGLAQHELGTYGKWYRNGRNWTWKPKGTTRSLELRVQVRDGRTHLALEERLAPLAAGLWGGMFGGSVGGAIGLSIPLGLVLLKSLAAAVAVFGAALAGAFFLTRAVYAGQARGRSRELTRLADQLVEAGEDEARSIEEERVRVAAGGLPQRSGRDERPERESGREREDDSRRRKRSRRYRD